MRYVRKRTATHPIALNALIAGAALGLVMALGVMDLAAAQQNSAITDNALRFIGRWDRDNEVPRGNCGGFTDGRGTPLVNCAIPVDQLPMNDRARAWLEYFDELQSPTLAGCVSITVPSLIGDVRPWSISFKENEAIINYEHANIFRHIWMDGRRHPPATDVSYHGHSIGHWDGDDLVVNTRNYPFDPDGLDDHLHFPTSELKHITERYSVSGPDADGLSRMTITITIEDPVFLTEPFTFTHHWNNRRKNQPLYGWWECDPQFTRREMELTAPIKYPDSDAGR